VRTSIKALYIVGALLNVMASNKLIAMPEMDSFVLAYALWFFWMGSLFATSLLLKKLRDI